MNYTVSLLIITYNRQKDLLELLQNLTMLDTTKVLEEVLILNNASTDSYSEVSDFIKAHPELKIEYIYSEENTGVARGRNTLMSMAKGDLMMIVDDDAVFTKPTDLVRLAALFNEPFFKEANTAIITPRVIYYDNKEVQLTAFPHKKYDRYATNPRFLTSYYIGCAHIMKREVLAKTGLYPTDFHYGMEEYDLGYRVLNAGYTIGFDNTVTVEHKESPLGRQPNFRKLQMQWVNKSKVAYRYLPFKYFITTALSWGVQYLKLAKGHFGTFLMSIVQIFKIPFTEKRNVVSENTLQYLKKTEARLKY
ncbi:MAG: glycosyltransferase family 2 protein [Taibaiella sp.]|nr:glycosyltransferase family 2 protein [Taibaiella sp.]